MPRIALISDFARAFDSCADARNVAMIKRRHAWWAQLARIQSWELGLCDANSLNEASGDLHGSVCWIDLPMLPRNRYNDLFERILEASPTIALDHPDHVERVLGLDRAYPILVQSRIPTPRTAFLPLSDEQTMAIDSASAVRRILTEAIYMAMFDAEINPHEGVFIRGFYSSVKSTNPEHYFGNNQTDIEATVFEVIRRLRVALDVGGLALREHLELERIEISTPGGERDKIRVPFEVRLTVLGGRLLMANYHGPFEVLADEPRRHLENELERRRAVIERAASDIAPALLAADLPPNYVADLAFVRGGGPVVLELNPLYAAGYNVPAAHALIVAALGADLAYRAGYRALPWAQILDVAAELVGAPIIQSSGVWLFENVNPMPNR